MRPTPRRAGGPGRPWAALLVLAGLAAASLPLFTAEGSPSAWQAGAGRQAAARGSVARRARPRGFAELEPLVEAGDIGSAEVVMRKLERAGSRKNYGRTLYNAMLEACANAGDCAAARTYYEEMRRKNVEPNSTTFELLVLASARAGSAEDADLWYEELHLSGFEAEAPTFSLLLEIAGQNGDLEVAERWYNWARGAQIEPAGDAFSALVQAAASKQDLVAAERWLERASRAGAALGAEAYAAALAAAAARGDAAAERRWEGWAKEAARAAKAAGDAPPDPAPSEA